MTTNNTNKALTDILTDNGYIGVTVQDCHFLGMPYVRVYFNNNTLTMKEIVEVVGLLKDATKAEKMPIDGFWGVEFESKSILLR